MDLVLEQLEFEWSPTGKYVVVNNYHKIRENEKLEINTDEGIKTYSYDELVEYVKNLIVATKKFDSFKEKK